MTLYFSIANLLYLDENSYWRGFCNDVLRSRGKSKTTELSHFPRENFYVKTEMEYENKLSTFRLFMA